MCEKCRSQRGNLSHYKKEEFPLSRREVLFVRISPRNEGGHDIGTKARCLCGGEIFWANLIQEMGSVTGGSWIAQCVQCAVAYALPYQTWDVIDKVNIRD
jgi:hypothetical protein